MPATASRTEWIELSRIDLPSNARPHNPDDLASLATDMGANGQLQEIIVAPVGAQFVVIAGVGRTLAARSLHWEKIRCLVKEGLSEFERLRITFSENEERENATPLYQARILREMMQVGGFANQNDLAKNLGKSQPVVSQYLSLLDLKLGVEELINASILTLRQLLEIKRLPKGELQVQLAGECLKTGLSGRPLKERVESLLQEAGLSPTVKAKKGRPSSTQVIKEQGCVFKQEGEEIAIQARFSRKEELDPFLAGLRGALLLWMSQHRALPVGIPSVPQGEPSFVGSMRPAASTLRFPSTPAEEAELEQVAEAGPAAVYAWIFGAGNRMVQVVEGQSWQDLGLPNAKAGVQKLLQSLKRYAGV